MNETFEPLEDAAVLEADLKAAWASIQKGVQPDPEVRARIWASCERSREDSLRRVGVIDVNEYLRPSAFDDDE